MAKSIPVSFAVSKVNKVAEVAGALQEKEIELIHKKAHQDSEDILLKRKVDLISNIHLVAERYTK